MDVTEEPQTEVETPEEPTGDPEPDESTPDEADVEAADDEGDEADTGDDGAGGEEEPQAPAEPSSFAATAEQSKALDAETKRHDKNLRNILGSAYDDLYTCPVCNPDTAGGFFLGDLKNPSNDCQRAVLAVLAPAPSVEYEPTPGLERCSVCKGKGQTKRPTDVEAHKLAMCSNCSGYGFYPPPGIVTNGAGNQDAALALVAAAHEPPVMDDVDAFGSPRLLATGMENPNYGRMPQYKSPEFP